MNDTTSEDDVGAARRVLILDHGRGFGGTVIVAATLLRHLDPSRYTAILVAAADPAFVATHCPSPARTVALTAPFGYVEAGRLRSSLASLGQVGRYLNFLFSSLRALANIPYLMALYRLVRREHIALIHCNNYSNMEGMLLAWWLRIPCVLHAHGLVGQAGGIGRLLRGILRPPVIAISRAVEQSVDEAGAGRGPVVMLHNPVEQPAATGQSRETFRDRFAIPRDVLLVGIVGRVVTWKGQAEFVQACLVAFEAMPSLHAVIVGDGSDFAGGYEAHVRLLAERSRHAHRFHFTGYVSDTAAAYRAMDILVHASIEPEPFGLVITEAMSHGVPVIAASTGAPPEIIEDGATGFLHDPRDSEGLGALIARLARDAALRRRIGERGQAHALEAFDAAAYARAVERVYDTALAERAARAR